MAATAKIRHEQSDERESALQSISERWQGNLAAYLEALARAKQEAEAARDEDGCIRSAVTISRMTRRR
jgi:hypothetical protein